MLFTVRCKSTKTRQDLDEYLALNTIKYDKNV